MPLSAEVPDELKFIVGYLQRGEELHAREPVISYYCLYYGAKQAIERNSQNKQTQGFLMKLLDQLEKDKAALAGNEAITNDIVGFAHVENFALRIFTNADNEDRAGLASKKTAKTFLAASIFLEVLKVFGTVEEHILEKIKYARFKAVDIIKALKEGRQPTAGPVDMGDQEADESQQATTSTHDNNVPPAQPSLPAPPSSNYSQYPATAPAPGPSGSSHASLGGFQPSPTYPVAPAQYQAPPPTATSFPLYPSSQAQYPSAPPVIPAKPAALSPSAPQLPIAHQPIPHLPTYSAAPVRTQPIELDPSVVSQATKHSKFAISALQYDDVNTAIDNLEKALNALRPYRR